MILNQDDFNTCKVYTIFDCICDYCGNAFKRSKRNLLLGRKTIQKDSCVNCAKFKREESSLILHGVKNAGGSLESLLKSKITNQKKYGVDNAAQAESIKEKNKKTCQERYGTDSFLATKECRESLCKYIAEHQDEINQKIKNTCQIKYGVDHYTKTEECKAKIKNACLEKYGVNSVFQAPQIKEQIEKTMQDLYGVKSPLQNIDILNKSKQTSLERYGFESYTQTEECKNKSKATCLDKYGVDNPQKDKNINSKTKYTSFRKYGNYYIATEECKKHTKELYLEKYNSDCYVKTEECKNKSKATCLEKYGVDSYSKTEIFKQIYKTTCYRKYGVSTTLLVPKYRKFGKIESEIKEWLRLNTNYVFKSDSKILQGKEIDLFNEELKFGIEYCGIYWHNELSRTPRDRLYHVDKFKKCEQSGIRLLTIFDDEWILRNEQCKDIILGALGKFETRYFARNCEVKQIDTSIGKQFCDKYHIQKASIRTKVYFGIFFEDEIIGVMSLGKHHRVQNKSKIVLNRLCFKNGIQIVGGASKLFKLAKKWSKENDYSTIITWSDNRWGSGNVYPKMGFTLDAELPPDYAYVDMKKTKSRISKQSQKKSNTNCPSNKTELEWATENGLARIWDCGKKRWIYNIL